MLVENRLDRTLAPEIAAEDQDPVTGDELDVLGRARVGERRRELFAVTRLGVARPQHRLADEKILPLGNTQSISLPFRLRPGVVLWYRANDRPAQDGFAIT